MIYLLNFDNKSCVTTLYLQTRSTSEVKTLLQTGQNAFCSRQRKLAFGGIDWKPPTSHTRVSKPHFKFMMKGSHFQTDLYF